MAFNRIILWLGNSLILIAIMMALTGVAGFMLAEFDHAGLFAAMAVFTAIIGLIFVFSTLHIANPESAFDALAFLLIFWTVVPVVVSIPYLVTGSSVGLIHAYFEGVSAFTTTGASALDPAGLPRTMHIWRSLLQWCGGVMAANFAVVVLAALNLRGTGVHRSMLFTFRRGEVFKTLTETARRIAMLYGAVSFVCFLILAMTGTPVFDAVCLSLTSIATGGLTPRTDLISNYVHHLGLFMLCLTCFLGAVNVSTLWDMFGARNLTAWRVLLSDPELRGMLLIAAILTALGLIYNSGQNIVTVISEAVFFTSTAGFDYHVLGLEMLPPAILIAVALIGGSALSTAGGLKIVRMLLLLRHAETDLARLSHPSRVVPVIFQGNILPDSAFVSVWAYFLGYTLLFGFGIICLAGFGLDFTMATTTSAASLSNMGPLLGYTLPSFGYEVFSGPQKLACALLMLAGRVEVLALIGILMPGIWRS